jgi:hypothetical protein
MTANTNPSPPVEATLAPRYLNKHSWWPIVAAFLTLGLTLVVINALQQVAEPAPVRTNQRFVLPEGFAGPLRVYYGITGAPPLPVENGWRVIKVPRSGHVETSSPIEYGNGQDVIVRYRADDTLETLAPQVVKRRVVGISGDTHEWANHALEINTRDKLIEAGNWISQTNGESLVGKPYEILYIRDDF